MINFLRMLLGRSKRDEQIVAARTQQAHDIKNQIQNNIASVMQEVRDVKQDSRDKISQMNIKLGDITKQIAVATGARRRGL